MAHDPEPAGQLPAPALEISLIYEANRNISQTWAPQLPQVMNHFYSNLLSRSQFPKPSVLPTPWDLVSLGCGVSGALQIAEQHLWPLPRTEPKGPRGKIPLAENHQAEEGARAFPHYILCPPETCPTQPQTGSPARAILSATQM